MSFPQYRPLNGDAVPTDSPPARDSQLPTRCPAARQTFRLIVLASSGCGLPRIEALSSVNNVQLRVEEPMLQSDKMVEVRRGGVVIDVPGIEVIGQVEHG
jgi:hypothetical protein